MGDIVDFVDTDINGALKASGISGFIARIGGIAMVDSIAINLDFIINRDIAILAIMGVFFTIVDFAITGFMGLPGRGSAARRHNSRYSASDSSNCAAAACIAHLLERGATAQVE
ncbi:MAG: hypothetical protein KF724_11805 [Phycisphaeraceae bacterium]|nr:hypothetical protein [Phycisphaeraceae bacterium]